MSVNQWQRKIVEVKGLKHGGVHAALQRAAYQIYPHQVLEKFFLHDFFPYPKPSHGISTHLFQLFELVVCLDLEKNIGKSPVHSEVKHASTIYQYSEATANVDQ